MFGGDGQGRNYFRCARLSLIDHHAEGVAAAEFDRGRLGVEGASGELTPLPVVNGEIDLAVGIVRAGLPGDGRGAGVLAVGNHDRVAVGDNCRSGPAWFDRRRLTGGTGGLPQFRFAALGGEELGGAALGLEVGRDWGVSRASFSRLITDRPGRARRRAPLDPAYGFSQLWRTADQPDCVQTFTRMPADAYGYEPSRAALRFCQIMYIVVLTLRFRWTVENCGRELARRLSSSGQAAPQMNVVDRDRIKSAFRPDVYTRHDWRVPRAEKLPRAAPISTKAYLSRHKRPYIGRPVGGDAKRPDCIHIIAGPKVEASQELALGATSHELAASATANRRQDRVRLGLRGKNEEHQRRRHEDQAASPLQPSSCVFHC